MTTLVRVSVLTLLLASLIPSESGAATFDLRDGKSFEGEILHFFRGIFTVRTTDGKEEIFGQNEVQKIDFGSSAPKAQKKMKTPIEKHLKKRSSNKNFLEGLSRNESKYASPLKTFELWLNSATKGDLEEMVKCYASFRKKGVKKELKKYSQEIREKMRASTAETKFIPGEPFYQGDRATLEVNWQKGVQGDSQVIQFILEGEDWKIIR